MKTTKIPRYVGHYPISHPWSALDQRPGWTILFWSFIKINEPTEFDPREAIEEPDYSLPINWATLPNKKTLLTLCQTASVQVHRAGTRRRVFCSSDRFPYLK